MDGEDDTMNDTMTGAADEKHLFDDDLAEESRGDEESAAGVDPVASPTSSSAGDPGKSSAQKADGNHEGVRNQIKDAGNVKDNGEGDEDEDEDEEEASEEEDGDNVAAASYSMLLKRGPSNARGAAQAWLSRVSVDGPGAVGAALSMVAEAARPLGPAYKPLIDAETIIANEPAETVARICDSMVGDAAGKVGRAAAKRGRDCLRAFWRSLVEECEDAVLYDTDCFDTLLNWLESYTVAASRPLRLAACIAAYAVVDGLITVGVKLRAELATAQRQLTTEEQKKSGKGAALSARGKDLRAKVDALTSNNAELNELTDKIFTSIFVLKYRDVAAEVRSESVSALGSWVVRYPEHFLDDTHNKYIGWLLFDKVPSVRRAALEVLRPMFENPKFVPSFEMFMRRFAKRIVEMSMDKDIDVCIAAVNLCSVLVPHDILGSGDDIDGLCALASSEHPELRRAAGGFVAAAVKLASDEVDDDSTAKALARGKDTSPTVGAGKGKKARAIKGGKSAKGAGVAMQAAEAAASMDVARAKEDIREVVFTVLGDDINHLESAGLVLDAVWEHMPAVHCWSAYYELFQEYSASRSSQHSGKKNSSNRDAENDQLAEEDMVSLAGLLLAAAKHVSASANSYKAPTGGGGKRGAGRAAGALATSEQTELTTCFAPVLPGLMTNFRTYPKVLAQLGELPRYFDMSAYTLSGFATHFKKLLTKLSDAIVRNSDSVDVMSSAAHTLKSLSVAPGSLGSVATTALGKEASNSARALHAVLRTGVEKSTSDAVSAALSRCAVISEIVDMSNSVGDDTLVLLRALCDRVPTVQAQSTSGANICRLVAGIWMWKSNTFLAQVVPADGDAGTEEESDDAVKSYVARRDEFIALLVRVVEVPDTDLESSIQASAFKSICLIVCLSLGLQRRMSQKNKDVGEDDSKHSFSTGSVHLMGVDFDEYGLGKAIRTSFIAAISGQTTPGAFATEVDSVRRFDKVTGDDQMTRDMLSSLGQVALLGALPDDVFHLPMLGLLLRRSRNVADEIESVSCYEMARLYYRRFKKSAPSSRATAVEAQLLLDAESIDQVCGEPDLPRVHFLATCIAREGHLVGSGHAIANALIHLIFSAKPMPGRGSEHATRAIGVFKICSILVGKLSVEGAATVLSKLDASGDFPGLDNDELMASPEWDGFLGLRQSLEAAASGANPPRGLQHLHSRKRRRGRGPSKNHSSSPKKPKKSKAQVPRTSVDMENVRRSGRTKRVTYAEVDSEESAASDSESDTSDDMDSPEGSRGAHIALGAKSPASPVERPTTRRRSRSKNHPGSDDTREGKETRSPNSEKEKDEEKEEDDDDDNRKTFPGSSEEESRGRKTDDDDDMDGEREKEPRKASKRKRVPANKQTREDKDKVTPPRRSPRASSSSKAQVHSTSPAQLSGSIGKRRAVKMASPSRKSPRLAASQDKENVEVSFDCTTPRVQRSRSGRRW